MHLRWLLLGVGLITLVCAIALVVLLVDLLIIVL